ncbi:hypothetical protein [Brevundimonas sp. DS20]|uniref:hypothetical protein n=1 Tax=Brevundimonas sp. DS20 TaxID=1532555 RepID=UPI001E4A8245|nr:hypothetical protein [Brevundimonas sp. DS20]MEC7797106.1 hypothetical protein [Pseudomonadota bacterium]MED5536610.1 hypothetical protein [Pseudomonadota bacterium]
MGRRRFSAMIPHALVFTRTCRTSDRRTIRWYECELVDDQGARRLRNRAFFSLDEAKSWASSEGYPVDDADIQDAR